MSHLTRISLLLISLTATLWAQNNPLPFLNQPLSPSSTAPGGPAFTLTVSGTGFATGAVLNWNGSPRTTTVISGSSLQASITAADIAKPNTASITITNPAPAGGTSLPAYFYVRNSYVSIALVNGPVLPNTGSVAVGDFNGDGKLDVAISQIGAGSAVGTIQVYLGNGNGTFQTPRSTPTYTDSSVQPGEMLIGDFNGDGKLDLLVTQNNNAGFEASWPQVFFGNGDGTFTTVPTSCGDGDYGVVGAAGDLNGDGLLDYIWMSGAQGNISPTVCIATGDENFKFTYAGFSFFSSNPAIGDFNNDGKLDSFSADSNTGSTFLGNGDGTFQGPLPPADTGNAAIGDVNRDGNLDAVLTNGHIWHGNGDGTFTATIPLSPSGNGVDLALQDTRGTNQLDVVMLGSSSLLIYPARSFSGGEYNPAISFPVSVLGAYGANLGVGDFNNDGRVDFVVPGATSTQVLVQTRLGIAPASLNYGIVPLGNSQVLNVVLTNVGSPSLKISGIKVVGADASSFSIPSEKCVTLISQDVACTLPVTFTPKASGALNASLQIDYDDIGSPQLFPLSGTGTPVKLNPVSINFGDQKVGTVSPPVKVTMYNLGTTALSITQIGIAGGTNFAETNNCGSSLPAHSTCAIKVTFAPTALGGQSAQLKVRFDAPGAEEGVRLSGNGT
jgi:hypothetical protein